MDVSVTELRANLSGWLDKVRAGADVVITDRGTPIVRLIAVDHAATLDRLTADGVIGRPRAARPTASGRPRVAPRRPVSERVIEGRR